MNIRISRTLFLIVASFVAAAALPGCKKETDPGRGGPGNNNNTPAIKKPVANAGPDQTIYMFNHFMFAALDGRASYDSSGTALRYMWRQISGPTYFAITSAETPQASFGPITNPNVFGFELKVYNANGSAWDTVLITIKKPEYCQANRAEVPVTLTYESTLPSHVQGPEMYVVEDKLIIPAWFDNETGVTSNKIYVYDRTAGSWSTIYASQARAMVTTVVAGNKILFAGGIDITDNASAVVDIYDFDTNTWTVTQLSQPRAALAGVLHGTKVYFAGGTDFTSQVSRRVDIYDLQTGTWTIQNLPSGARHGITAVATQDKVMFCGGYTYVDHSPSRVIQIYTPVSNSWSTDSLLENKVHFAATIVNNQLLFTGGDMASFHVERWNLLTNARSSACLNQWLSGPNVQRVVVKNEKVLFYSYQSSDFTEENKMDIYNWQTDTWSVGVMPVSLFPEVTGSAIAIAGQQVYLLIGDKLYLMNI
jgi:N-acetylneuraminic acid mutarotase